MMSYIDVLVIGAGPAGLSVCAECVYHEVDSVLLLEKGTTHNQTVHHYYPDDKRVDASYKGQEAICAGLLCFRDTTKANFLFLVNRMLETFPFPITYGCHVDSIKRGNDGIFSVSTGDGHQYSAKFVVIAIGRMGKPNRPEYFNDIPTNIRRRIQFDVHNLDALGKEILVVGGGNSAIEFALSLARRGQVTVSYRKDIFTRLNPMNLHLLEEDEKNGRIEILRQSNIETIVEDHGKPLVRFEGGKVRAFDHVVFGIGGSSPAAFLQNAGMILDEGGIPNCSRTWRAASRISTLRESFRCLRERDRLLVSFRQGCVH
jgi:thioredoxin reductase (NADPH)